MNTEIEVLNSPEKKEQKDTNFDTDYTLSDESGVKRTFNEIADENTLDGSQSPVLSKKACLSSKKLKQPFRSPLKAGGNVTKPLEVTKKEQDSPEKSINVLPSEENENSEPIITSNITPTRVTQISKTPTKKATFRSPLVSSKNITDPKINALYKRRLELERKIWETDEHIKTIETAKTYENKDDSKLEKLIDKWRLAAQQAAVQLFTIVSERIESVGGLNAWYKQFETSRSILSEWNPLPEPEKDEIEYNNDISTTKETPQPDVFTMSMMLEKLNIPHNLIGWDAETETWL